MEKMKRKQKQSSFSADSERENPQEKKSVYCVHIGNVTS